MSDRELPITIRQGAERDMGFILASFTRELHKTIPYNFIPNSTFFPHYTALLHSLVAKSTVLVATVEDSPDDLVGFLIAQPLTESSVVVHWSQVKHIFQHMGVFKALLEAFGCEGKTIVCSHYFTLFPKIRDRYHMIYDPFVLDGGV